MIRSIFNLEHGSWVEKGFKKSIREGREQRGGNQSAISEVILAPVWPRCHPFSAGKVPGLDDAPDASMHRSSLT